MLKEITWHLETYDCTTIRASVPMFLLSKYVSENTDIKVILSAKAPTSCLADTFISTTRRATWSSTTNHCD